MAEVEDVGLSGQNSPLTISGQVSLVYIQVPGVLSAILLRVARRIRKQVRSRDTVLLLEDGCALVLPATSMPGAEAVARRVSMLLVDVETHVQVLYGAAALEMLRRLQAQGAKVLEPDECSEAQTEECIAKRIAQVGLKKAAFSEPWTEPMQAMPYLAFLSHYPSRRLLHLFPYELACRYSCIPIGAERDMLTLGTARWFEQEIIARFSEATGRGIFQVRCELSLIEDVLRYWESLLSAQEVRGTPERRSSLVEEV